MSKPALILQHEESAPPGLLAEWAAHRGLAYDVHRTDRDEPLPELDGRPFIASLGSDQSPRDTHVAEVRAQLEFTSRAVDHGIPVLGLCYGGQVLAHVLGAAIEPAPAPELGWHEIDSSAPDLVPPGPWLQWHYYRFTLPPGAEQLARSNTAIQAFAHGPHLGVQFHPEATIEIVSEWARLDAPRLAELGIEDGLSLVQRGHHHTTAARSAAYKLFDAFWERSHA